MSTVMTASVQKRAMRHISGLIAETMEEEIFALNSIEPKLTKQLPSIFADSVVRSASSILGEATGEALIRRIGEDKLKNPASVYQSLDEFLQGGADFLKGAIREEFRVRVHKLYRMTLELAREDSRFLP